MLCDQHDACCAMTLSLHASAQLAQIVQQCTKLGDMALGNRRQTQGLAAPVYQLYAQPGFKQLDAAREGGLCNVAQDGRSEEHTSELQSLMRISYAVFCLKKKKPDIKHLKIQ